MIKDWTPDSLVDEKQRKHTLDANLGNEDGATMLVIHSSAGPYVAMKENEEPDHLNLVTTGYLGLQTNPDVLDAAEKALRTYGVGACGPRGFYGTVDVHLDLEKQFAQFMGTPEAVLYSSGFATISGVIPSFCKSNDYLFVDQGVSFATQVGVTLARSSKTFWFTHNDIDALTALCERFQSIFNGQHRIFVIVEGIYINHADIAPMDKIVALKKKFPFRIICEESHSVGILGKHGRGIIEHFNIPIEDVDIIAASTGHALGAVGGFCVGPPEVTNHQRLSSSSYVFSCSLPPYIAAGTIECVKRLQSGTETVGLHQRIADFGASLKSIESFEVIHHDTPIAHLRLKKSLGSRYEDEKLLQSIVESLRTQKKVLVQRALYCFQERNPPPPSIRITICTQHSSDDIKRAMVDLEAVAVPILRIKVETGKDFVYDPVSAKKSDNVTDKWVLASLQSLIQFVRKEMQAYRLYTVVPRLVKFIESLANWYVRLNRGRLKGKSGLEEEQVSLNTLVFTLLSMCRMMAPFTPFFVETLYQNLKMLLPEEERKDSVHYLSIPEVDESLFNPEIEVHIARMQEVIELGRLARDLAICPVRQPLKNFIVFHQDTAYLESLKFLQSYIQSELAISNLVLRSDVKEGVVHTLSPNNVSFGPKVRDGRKKVTEALTKLTHDEIIQFLQEGKITVAGHELLKEDLIVVSEFKGDNGTTKYQSSSNSNVVTALDLTKDQDSLDGRLVRELSNRIQRLRKHANLVHTDHVIAFYSWSVAASETSDYNLDRVLKQYRTQIEDTTHCSIVSSKFHYSQYFPIDEQTSNLIDSVNVKIVLCRPDAAVDEAKVTAAGYDYDSLQRYLLIQNPATLKDTLEVLIDGKLCILKKGLHWFEHAAALAQSLDYPFDPPVIVQPKETDSAPSSKPSKPAPAREDKQSKGKAKTPVAKATQ